MKIFFSGVLLALCLATLPALAQEKRTNEFRAPELIQERQVQERKGKKDLRPADVRELLTQEKWQNDIRHPDKDSIQMENGREYKLEKNAVIEYLDFKDDTGLRNVFDFENGLVFHQEIKSRNKLAVTPFSMFDPARIGEIRNIGCHIAGRSGSGNPAYADRRMYDFLRRFCLKPIRQPIRPPQPRLLPKGGKQ